MRSIRRYLVSLTALVLLAGPALAQPAATQPAAGGDILNRIPANAMGFVVVKNLSDTGAKVDKFIADIGLKEMVQGNVLQMAKTMLLISKGINDNGGLAVVMLDPAQFDWDLKGAMTGTEPKGMPPVAVIIPGNKPMDIFASYKPTEEAGYVQFELGDKTMYAKAMGEYTVAGPTTKVVDAVVASTDNVTKKLGEDHKALVLKEDLAVYIDMKMLTPYLLAALDKAQAQMKETEENLPEGSGRVMIMSLYAQQLMPMYKDMLSQVEGVSMGARISRTGVLVESFTSYVPDSRLAKMVSAMKVSTEPLLDKLPGLPYVLALGARGQSPAKSEMVKDILTKALASDALAKAPAEAKTKLIDAVMKITEQTAGTQVYIGGAPAKSGLFAVSCVSTVKDAKVYTAALADLTDSSLAIIKAVLGEEAKDVSIKYVKAGTKVEDASVDTIDITFPQLDVGADEKESMAKILGEDKLSVYVATVNDTTVVVSFGGSVKFLGEAIKAARSGNGPLPKDPGVVKAMAELPKNPMIVAFFSPANLLEVIKTGAKTMAGDNLGEMPAWMKMTFETKTPIALGSAVKGNGEYETIYIPTALVAEGVKKYMQMMSGGEEEEATPATKPAGNAEDF